MVGKVTKVTKVTLTVMIVAGLSITQLDLTPSVEATSDPEHGEIFSDPKHGEIF